MKKYLAGLPLIFCSLMGFCQETSKIAEAIPPSPNAYSFAKFGEIPVDYSTGTANISIPIWNVKGRELSFPLNLSYNSSGIKVQEEASWVGLGWNLSSGGSIVRVVKGLPDELAQQRYDSHLDIGTLHDDQTFLQGVSDQLYDAEPDIFIYNIFGQSGKFVLYQNVAYFLSHKNVSITTTPYGNTMTFSVISEDGTVFEFDEDGMESTTYNSDGQTQGFISAWNLTRVSSANSLDIMQFNYADEVINTNSIVGQSISIPAWNSNPACGNLSLSNQTINSTVNSKRLILIQTSTEQLVFQPQSVIRPDVGVAGTTSYALEEIRIYENTENKLQKTFKMVYNPLSPLGSALSQRLVLKEVREVVNESILAHKFEYDESLPQKDSKSLDYWGYYNGKPNSSLIPKVTIQLAGAIEVGDADRNADPAFNKAGSLMKITYPTGGWTDFEYGANVYTVGEIAKDIQTQAFQSNGNGSSWNTEVIPFEISKEGETAVGISCNINVVPNADGLPNEADYQSTFSLFKINEGSIREFILSFGTANGSIIQNQTIILTQGQYEIETSSYLETATLYGSVSWDSGLGEIEVVEKFGPGLRIERITSNSGTPGISSLVKSYDYVNTNGQASGVLISQIPEYYSTSYSRIAEVGEGGIYCRDCYRHVVSSSGASSSLPSPDYTFIYSEVKEMAGESDENGYSKYKYIIGENNEALLKESLTYSALINEPIQMVENNYLYVQDREFKGLTIVNVETYDCPVIGSEIRSDLYRLYCSWNYLSNTINRVRQENGSFLTTTTNYYYGNNHRFPKRIETQNSSGDILQTINKYPQDYAGIADALISKHAISSIIEQQQWKVSAGTSKLLSGKILEYNNTLLKPEREFRLETNVPLSTLNNELIDGNNKFTTLLSDTRFSKQVEYKYKLASGVLIEQKTKDGITSSLLWNSNESAPIAVTTHATSNQVFFEGFENSAGTTSSNARSGQKLFVGDFLLSTPQGFEILSNTQLSYWYFSEDKWHYKKIPFNGESILLSDGDYIDDIRIYPEQTKMITYTYNAGVGVSSVTDENNISTYYQYDNFNRLAVVMDNAKDIQKMLCYKINGDWEDCPGLLYDNESQSQNFTRNNCDPGYAPTTITYTVVAGKHKSAISRFDANQKALADIQMNGQSFANQNGGCQLVYYNSLQQQSFIRNNCIASQGTSVIYQVPAGTYSSIVSQAAADQLAIIDLVNNGQVYANTNGLCTYFSVAVSQNFTRNNCGTGVGGSIQFSAPAGMFSSTVNQTSADQLAQQYVNNNGQVYANTNGTCTFYNIAIQQYFTRNDCGYNGVGSSVQYLVPQNKYSSTLSQADANQKATNEIIENGQANANVYGNCTYINEEVSNVFTRNTCYPGEGSTVPYTVPAGTYTSYSLENANQQAYADLLTNGQLNANANGFCTYRNVAQSKLFTKNNCGSGIGSSLNFSVPANVYSSTISQEDANQMALNFIDTNGQTYVNTNGYCTFYNVAMQTSFNRNNCGYNGTGSSVSYYVPQGQYSSTISQADANQKAINATNENGQQLANTQGSCTYFNETVNGVFTRNTCYPGVGSEVPYTVSAGTYTSYNLEQANQQAYADLLTNGQLNANANGYCTYYNVAKSQAFVRNNCGCGYAGSSVTISVSLGTYSSLISQEDADQKALLFISTNGQINANTNGSCTFTCYGEDKKIINCICATGVRINIDSFEQGSGWICRYRYYWSEDGSYSEVYEEYNTLPCAI